MRKNTKHPPVYSDETFSKLCQRFNIPDSSRTECRDHLESFAEIWRWNNSQWQNIRQPGQDKLALEALAKHSKRLKSAFQQLSPDAMTALENINMRYNFQAITSDAKYSSAGHEFYRFKTKDDVDSILVSDVVDLGRSISILETIAREAIADIRPMPAGARKNHALRLWVSNIADLWTTTLKRRFTRDVVASGEPISEAAQFCVAAFTPISPSMPSSKIVNEMKTYITKSRKASTGNNCPE